MSATDDVARMLTLVPWLLERPGAGLDETADAFGVSPRTIRDDLGHLDFCGLPGLGGGDLFDVDLCDDRITVSMADELRRPLRLTPQEALRLVLTVDAVADALADELPALRRGLARLREAAGVPEVVADVLGAAPTERVAAARRAVADARQVRLTYQGRGDRAPRERLVDAWALHLRDGAWYLQGRDHEVDELRTFRLDRIIELAELDAARASEPPDELPEPRYVPGPDHVEAELRLTGPGRWVLEALQADEVEHLDHATRVVLHTDAPEWLTRLVLMAGGDAEVVGPAWLRERVRDEARAALRAYRPSG